MGNSYTVPEPDENTKKAMVLAHLKPKELKRFYKCFKKFDKNKIGLVKLSDWLESMEEERTVFTDSLAELLDIEHDGRINFGDFLFMVCTYCLFEPREILRFCFFVFDQDKHGYFETTELKLLMNILHKVPDGETVKGNIKISWQNMDFAEDERIDWDEIVRFHKEFPRLFQPAFNLNINMRRYVMGERYWERKKDQIRKFKEEQKKNDIRTKNTKEMRAMRAAQKKLRRRMGLCRYYCCPFLRPFFDGSFAPPPTQQELDARAKRAAEIAAAKRAAELALKNPNTDAWEKYKEKKVHFEEKENASKENNEKVTYLEVQQEKILRKRNQRVERRQDRRNNRKKVDLVNV